MRVRSDRRMVSLVAVAAFVLIASSVTVGLRTPAERRLSGLPGVSTLDYDSLVGRLSPLSRDFIADSLGLVAGSAPVVGTSVRPGSHGAAPEPEARLTGANRSVVQHPLNNDHFADAYAIRSLPFTGRTDSSTATREQEPSDCSPVGPTVWYRYRADRDEGLIVSTIGTDRATGLGVFTTDEAGELNRVRNGCHSSVTGDSYVSFSAYRASTYYFQVTDLGGGGPLVFNLDPAGTTEMVSLAMTGKHGNASSGFTAISKGGRHVLFTSAASDLVPDDTNGVEDVFVRDLLTGTTERVSVSSDGVEGNRESKPWPGSISADGRHVAFTSLASNLVPGDTNGANDVFVHDRVTRQTTRVSVSSSGRQGQIPADPASMGARTAVEQSDDATWLGATSMSADGRYVVFDSELIGLVAGDDRSSEPEAALAGVDVFVHDRLTGETRQVSLSSRGANADDMSVYPDISADGRYVAFASRATNLIDDESLSAGSARRAKTLDVYVRDLQTSTTERVSVTATGNRANGASFAPSISPYGRFVAFASVASDLIEFDTNESVDVFVRDRVLGTTERVSVSSTGEQQVIADSTERTYVNQPRPDMSWDGRYVVFTSTAANLVPRDTNADTGSPEAKCGTGGDDVFIRDRLAGTTRMVSVSSAGVQGNGASNVPSISADGRRIAFDSWASNLVESGVDEPSALGPVYCDSSDSFVHTLPGLR